MNWILIILLLYLVNRRQIFKKLQQFYQWENENSYSDGTVRKLYNWLVNFIIGDSGSNKQMLCASSGAHVAQNISAGKINKKK